MRMSIRSLPIGLQQMLHIWPEGALKVALTAASIGVLAGCSGAPTSEPTSTESTGAVSATCDATKDTRFYSPPADAAATQQVLGLLKSHDLKDALLLTDMLAHPKAVWFTSGTPAQVQKSVRQTTERAAIERSVPILVAYDIPFRDCAQYSGGGATDTAAYEAWIDGFAKGIGGASADVILEPDSLGIIPYNTTIYGAAEWCQPDLSATGLTPAQANQGRYDQLSYAITSLKTNAPNAKVYLDGTHASWLGVGEAAFRLNKAGVAQAAGFYQNVSNFQSTANSITFGTWVSQCYAAATVGASWAAGHFDWCPSQYDPALGYAVDYSAAYAATVTASLEGMLGGAVATLPFVIDTSRNGNGPLDTSVYAAAPFNQPASAISGLNGGAWCNPPGAGLGIPASANTGVPLLDAYLWVKTPGESDGQCDAAGGARGWDYTVYNPWNVAVADQPQFDPLWGMVDPGAGVWFPAQGLQLAQDANPALFK